MLEETAVAGCMLVCRTLIYLLSVASPNMALRQVKLFNIAEQGNLTAIFDHLLRIRSMYEPL
jgi:hypothetical protein